jgi:alpha-glucosidase
MKLQKFIAFIWLLLGIYGNAQSTASKQVSTFTIDAPQLENQKTIWVYLPKDYQNSKKSYPVIYMHDAQNLFDEKTSFVGEWKIDEYLDTIDKNESIIIGIEHGNEKRIDELTPYVTEKYGGGKGDLYLDFIVRIVKPKIDNTYNTLKDAKHTTIFGSSLGGLISLYAVIKYPETFDKAGVFSPAIWINKDKMFELVKSSQIDPDKKFYFLVGSEEGETLENASIIVSDQHEMVQLLKDKGITDKNIVDRVIANGHHNETLWSTYFSEAYQGLFAND